MLCTQRLDFLRNPTMDGRPMTAEEFDAVGLTAWTVPSATGEEVELVEGGEDRDVL